MVDGLFAKNSASGNTSDARMLRIARASMADFARAAKLNYWFFGKACARQRIV
jgi:hypothetical protein